MGMIEDPVRSRQMAKMLDKTKARDTTEITRLILSSPIKRGSRVVEADGIISMEELSQSNTTVETRIIAQMAFNAARGDVKSAEFIFKYAGLEPPQKQEVLLDIPTIVNDMDNRLEPVPPSPLAMLDEDSEE